MISSVDRAGRRFSFLLLTLFLCASCAEENPMPPRVHPGSWMIRESENFHGRRVASYGVPFCQSCHEEDLRGGTKATSCYACHALAGTCSGCHGRIMWDFAPPPDVSGNQETDAIGVGAHLFHVNPSLLADGYDCTECHTKPSEIASPGHVDDGLPAEIEFGSLAGAGGAVPEWDRSGPSCSGVYCHGATLEGGPVRSPGWTNFPPEDELCGECHPVESMSQGSHSPHIAVGFDCSSCHDGYTTETVVTASHVNGSLEVALAAGVGGSYDGRNCSGVRCHGAGNTTPAWGEPGNFTTCTECHGGAEAPDDTLSASDDVLASPPTDLSGESFTSSRGVGAHRNHVVESEFRVHMECSECHVRPDAVDSDGHVDGDLVAEVVFGELARTDEAEPVWNTDGLVCSGTYCHGATHAGGAMTTPQWNVVDGSQAFCGSCHGIPPHDDFGPCNICHGNVVSADTLITDFGKTLHINGEINF